MLQVFITNNIRIRGASVPLRAAITKELTLDNPTYIERKKRRQPTWGLSKKSQLFFYDRGSDLITPRGFKNTLIELLKEQGVTPSKVIVERTTEGPLTDFGEWNPAFIVGASPREYQPEAVEAALEKGGTLVSPAGSGKTLMGCRYIYEKGRPAIWLTHTIDLLEQAKAAAEKYMLGVGKVGQLGGKKVDYGDGKLIVATVQTLQANPHLIEGLNDIIGTVVVDEAHHFPAPAFIEVAGKFKARNLLGLTATPERKDRLEAYLYTGIGPVCYQVERDGMYEAGAIIKPEVKFIYTDFSEDQASDYDQDVESVDAGGDDMDYTALMKAIIYDTQRAKLVAENIIEAAPHGPAIVITESVRYCYILRNMVEKMAAARYRGIQLKTAVVHGGISRYKWVTRKPPVDEILEVKKTKHGTRYKVEAYTAEEFEAWQVTKSQRQEILAAAKDRKIDILFATQLAREGLDIPHLTVGHMVQPKRGDASGSKNGAAVEQEIGRIMRPDPKNPNKKAVWYDYVDYDVGVFRSQYNSRRSVYRRLGLTVPRKPKTERETIEDFLVNTKIFDMPY